MGAVRRQARETAVALVAGVWALAFARSQDVTAGVVLALLVTLGLLFVHTHPVISGLGVAGVIAAGNLWFGVPGDSPWFLAGALVALYAAGHHATPLRAGPVLVVFWTVVVSLDPTVATAVFAAVLVTAPWGLGAVLRGRSIRAERAAAEAAALARVDAGARAAAVVAEERARLAVDVLSVVRDAVERMQVQAARAQKDLDRDALASIQQQGRHATAELRRMLGLLRSEPELRADSAGTAVSGRGRPPWLLDALAALGLATVFLLENALGAAPGVPPRSLSVASALWLIGTVALRRREPALACVLATVAPTLALLLDLRLGYGLWSAGVSVLLVLAATAERDKLAWAALTMFSTAFVFDVFRHDPENAPITLTTLVLAAITGYGWASRTRAERVAHRASAAIRAEHDAAAERALRADRLKLARELHDITSHAVGVMVLQAGAAAALRERDPVRARESVDVIQSTAIEALAQVADLLGLLDAGTIGVPGMAAAVPAADFNQSIADLVERTRHAGLCVSLDLIGDPGSEPMVLTTAYRIVQESLTNAMRHAAGSAVHVSVRRLEKCLTVSVRNDSARAAPAGAGLGGYGLVGLSERVAALGGELRTGPRPGGGFEAHALLPLHPAVETPT